MAKNDPPKKRKPIVIDVDADPHNANWIRILEQQRLAQLGQPSFPPPAPLPTPTDTTPQLTEAEEEMPNMADTTDKPWDGSASRWPDAASYAKSCLIDLNEPGQPKSKSLCKLPVREPDGTLNSNAVHSAASALVGGMGGVSAPAPVKKAAARTLVRLYAQLKEQPPTSIKQMAM